MLHSKLARHELLFKKNREREAEGMSQVVDNLLSKQEALSSNSSTDPLKKNKQTGNTNVIL
jgi:hypothetical protein